MHREKKPTLRFPKRFLWGASTAAHQVEGGLHNQWTVWEQEHAKKLAAQASYQFGDVASWPQVAEEAQRPDTYISGRGVEHYQRYEEDFDLLEQLHFNAFRFGIEWARIEPEEGCWDAEAIAHYRAYLKSLKARGITPVVTLFHFTLPVWFVERGGFEKRRNIRYFTRYAQKVLDELGGELSYIITINEPTVYVGESYLRGSWPPNRTSKWQSWRVLRHLITAHRRIYTMTRSRRRWKVSMAHHLCYIYPGDDAWLSDTSARLARYVVNDYTLKRVRRYSDFLGINYYFAHRIYGYRSHSPYEQVSDMGWDMQPELLAELLEEVYERYNLPVLITENGLADGADTQRQWWLSETLKAMHAALGRGVALIGYLHWSLLDNFEWDKGYWPRFGLVAVNRTTMQRTVRPSARWFSRVVQKLRD